MLLQKITQSVLHANVPQENLQVHLISVIQQLILDALRNVKDYNHAHNAALLLQEVVVVYLEFKKRVGIVNLV
tara:strand:- start:601 stop:819 length:219 start_codon:yes stop_codon:yes gene_type:complete